MAVRSALRKIVFTWRPGEQSLALLRRALPDVRMVVAEDDQLARELRDAQLLVGMPPSDEILAEARQLSWVHVPFAGVERVLRPSLVERGVTITNSRGVSAPNMAEHIVAMMLAFARGLPDLLRSQQKHEWRPWGQRPPVFELTDQTVLLLGVGAIGQATAHRLRPFGARLIGARRRPEQAAVPGIDRIIAFDVLPEVLPEADHVVSSLPLTPTTVGIVSAEMIERFKPGAYFYNVGRGGTVDQEALVAALRRGHLAGAGLDVTDPEPLPPDSPLWDMPNVIITGHTSGASPRTEARVVALLEENVRRYIDGRELLNVVDPVHGY